MQHFDITASASFAGFQGSVRISQGLIDDSLYCRADMNAVERFEFLLQDTASQLANYPTGTQAARLTHYRIPPNGDKEDALGLELEAIVCGSEEGKYLLLAKANEMNQHAAICAA